ncbi:MAG: hypothetical protein TREMPRED_001759 [Tremellales sp. Tagirdzhanova-0007]|nr:MAG: hypothetical protein TREMPRED_001759 [Tremellales sp. Tagirdzhanova-0007]
MLFFPTCLSLFALAAEAGPSRPDSRLARNVLEGKAQGYCSPSGPIEFTHCLYETVERLNAELYPALKRLVGYPFFRHYKVDLYRECPFWYENGFCMNRACGVEAADEDFCYIEDDATQDGQYIDLTINPERFTGYAGDSAHHVWRAIYEENCFGLSEASMDAAAAVASQSGRLGFSKLSEGWGTEMVQSLKTEDEMCEEKKVYYRVISGLHASISIHICHDYLDQQTGEWAPNLQCFITRLASHPERLSNVYFNAVLLLRAVTRAAPYLRAYDIGTAPMGPSLDEKGRDQQIEDRKARDALSDVLRFAGSDDIARGFDEGDFFAGEDAAVLKEQFKTHFRNVSRIMDCVGCDKCRLWGKLQVSGLGTALKILFELDEKALDPKINPDLLQRSEVVALFNTLSRTTESLAAVDEFRKMYAKTQNAEAEAARRRKERQTKRKQMPPPPIPHLTFSPSAIFGLLLSAVEAFRRSCRGCVEVCWKQLDRGPIGEALQVLRKGFGAVRETTYISNPDPHSTHSQG